MSLSEEMLKFNQSTMPNFPATLQGNYKYAKRNFQHFSRNFDSKKRKKTIRFFPFSDLSGDFNDVPK